jgi:hypothetical protein
MGMKKTIFPLLIGALFFPVNLFAQELTSKFLFDLRIDLNPPQVLGPVLKGTRIISSFKDGQVKGDIINGKILPFGGDWGLLIDSGTFRVDSRATIQTDDGSLIYITYSGYNHSSAKVAAMIGAGRGGELSPSAYYFRTVVSFETSAAKYAWLNYVTAVGVGAFPGPGEVAFRIYAIE